MSSSVEASSRLVDRVTARVVLVVAAVFLLSGVDGVVRGVSDGRIPWLALFAVLCAVTSIMRARRYLGPE